ncbi:MAG TPA: sigma-70 family RNA polymerase sigma factor [Nannocystaceae bacterium]|nr:sigma-70 family RNA polymerase sigma factor [Nannocystaceae bacterium]
MTGDAELLEAWRMGDGAAGQELFARHAASVMRFFRNKLDVDLEDLVQRTFLACVESRDRVRDGSSFRAYVLRIARNELVNHYVARQRAASRVDPLTTSILDMGASPSVMVASDERDRALLTALRRLPLDLQTALELHYWEELSTSELAEVLGIPQGTVKTRLFRAREQLRVTLREAGAVGLDPDGPLPDPSGPARQRP